LGRSTTSTESPLSEVAYLLIFATASFTSMLYILQQYPPEINIWDDVAYRLAK
jgi:hypothetical protein